MSRWETKFGSFVHSYGITSLAQALDVDKTAVHHWIGGRNFPKPSHAAAMQILAGERGMTLSLDDIYEGPRQFLAQACSLPTTDLPAALSRGEQSPVEQKIAAALRKNPLCR